MINIVGKGALDSCTYLLQIQISVHNPWKKNGQWCNPGLQYLTSISDAALDTRTRVGLETLIAKLLQYVLIGPFRKNKETHAKPHEHEIDLQWSWI